MTERPGRRSRWLRDDYLPYLLASAAYHVAGRFHAGLRRHDLSVLTWRVLATLADGRGYAIHELCDRCLAKQPTVSKLLDRLEAQRLVRRRRDPDDGRIVVVELTDAGRRRIAPVLAEAQAYDRSITVGTSSAQLRQLKALLRELIERHRS